MGSELPSAGPPLSAAIPLAYSLCSALSLVYFATTKDYARFRLAQLGMFLVAPFLLQWSLGGFGNSSAVMVWAFISPVGALLLSGTRGALPWFGAYVALIVASVVLDGPLSARVDPLPTAAVIAFFATNISGVSLVTYLTLQHFVRERERAAERSEWLLLNVLPREIAERLKHDPQAIADGFTGVTVLFADLVEFTAYSSRAVPAELVSFLNEVFSEFDRLAEGHGLEKIKTIGDAYMVAAGLPTPRSDHCEAIAEMALDVQDLLAARRFPDGRQVSARIGIHTGPVVAGVIGKRKFIYDLWGDTVNVASRMESHGVPGEIQVTPEVYERLRDRYRFAGRGLVKVKGKGELLTYLLLGRGQAAPLRTDREQRAPARA